MTNSALLVTRPREGEGSWQEGGEQSHGQQHQGGGGHSQQGSNFANDPEKAREAGC
jgi:general stress protein YciG